jgi:streptogramin lyase
MWFNVYYGSARLDPTTKKWQVFQSSPPYDGFSYGMAVDTEDNGWWSAWDGDEVYKGDVKTGKVTAIAMRDPEYDARKALATKEDLEFYESHGSLAWGGLGANPVPYASAPRRLAADKHGATVWVPNWAGSNIAEIDIHSLHVTYHKLPVTGNAYKTDLDNQHNVYASVPLADSLVKYDPATKSWTVYPFATHGCGPRHVSVDRIRGEVWVPCDQASKVQRFQFRTAAQIRSQKTAAQAGANR